MLFVTQTARQAGNDDPPEGNRVTHRHLNLLPDEQATTKNGRRPAQTRAAAIRSIAWSPAHARRLDAARRERRRLGRVA